MGFVTVNLGNRRLCMFGPQGQQVGVSCIEVTDVRCTEN